VYFEVPIELFNCLTHSPTSGLFTPGNRYRYPETEANVLELVVGPAALTDNLTKDFYPGDLVINTSSQFPRLCTVCIG